MQGANRSTYQSTTTNPGTTRQCQILYRAEQSPRRTLPRRSTTYRTATRTSANGIRSSHPNIVNDDTLKNDDAVRSGARQGANRSTTTTYRTATSTSATGNSLAKQSTYEEVRPSMALLDTAIAQRIHDLQGNGDDDVSSCAEQTFVNVPGGKLREQRQPGGNGEKVSKGGMRR